MENADLEYLLNNEVIYIALEGEAFNMVNYIYEYNFTKMIKAGGYGTVYFGNK